MPSLMLQRAEFAVVHRMDSIVALALLLTFGRPPCLSEPQFPHLSSGISTCSVGSGVGPVNCGGAVNCTARGREGG